MLKHGALSTSKALKRERNSKSIRMAAHVVTFIKAKQSSHRTQQPIGITEYKGGI
jgi:hypothetical protein